MSLRTRIVVALLCLVVGGFTALVWSTLHELRPRYLESMEDSLVDMAQLLASRVELELKDGAIDASRLSETVQRTLSRDLSAKIFGIEKKHVVLRVLALDAHGKVLYDSQQGRDQGRDYSHWNDVIRTLRGEYGSRSTHDDPLEPGSSVKYVSAPVRHGDRIVGIITVGKPSRTLAAFIDAARSRLLLTGFLLALASIFAGIALSYWITRPLENLTHYARAIRDGERAALPRLSGAEAKQLGEALEQMREALEGKKYVERYTQTLAHELKSPLSAIRGAAEILAENPPEPLRSQFLENLATESTRIAELVDRMLLLASLESRERLDHAESVDLAALVDEICASFLPQLSSRKLTLVKSLSRAETRGDAFLLRHAIANLIQNAIEFSPENGKLAVRLEREEAGAALFVEDDGPGIPDYAGEKVFDRFYSLPRPSSGKRSSGLGLSLVREVANLHGGAAALENRRNRGARASLRLPLGGARA